MTIGELFAEAIKGTVSGLTLAAVLALANFLRNLLLERRLREGFSKVGYSFGEDSFGIILHNMTSANVKVWGVRFNFPDGGYTPLHFSGEKVPFRKIRLHRFRKPRWQVVDFPAFHSDEAAGAVSLDFDTSGTWEMKKERVVDLHPPPEGAYCLLEYTTLLRASRRIVVKVAKVDELRDAFLRYRGRWVKETA